MVIIIESQGMALLSGIRYLLRRNIQLITSTTKVLKEIVYLGETLLKLLCLLDILVYIVPIKRF